MIIAGLHTGKRRSKSWFVPRSWYAPTVNEWHGNHVSPTHARRSETATSTIHLLLITQKPRERGSEGEREREREREGGRERERAAEIPHTMHTSPKLFNPVHIEFARNTSPMTQLHMRTCRNLKGRSLPFPSTTTYNALWSTARARHALWW